MLAAISLLVALPGVAFAQAGNDPPVFPRIPDPFVFEGTTASVDASATDPDGDPLTYAASGPPWLTINAANGLCTLEPDYAAAQTDGGLHPVTVEADDGTNLASTGFTVQVLDAPTAANLSLELLFDTFESKTDVYTVIPATGEMVYDPPPDLVLGGPMPLMFDRHYASIRAWETSSSAFLPTTNFQLPYDWKIHVGATDATVTSDRGRVFRFQAVGPGGWALTSPLDAPYQLVQLAGGFLFANPTTQMRYTFDSATFRLLSVADQNNNTHTLSYSGDRVTQVADGLGRALSFTHDAQDRVISASDGTRTTRYSYDAATGELALVTDALGRVTQYAYAPGPVPGLLASVTLPVGNTPHTFSYDAQQGRLLLDSDASGGTWAYGVMTIASPLGVQATAIKNGGPTFAYEWGRYDPALPYLLLLSAENPAAGITTYDYDAVGRLISHTRPAGDTRQVTYHAASGFPASLLLPDGTTTTYSYAARSAGSVLFHDLVQADFPDGSTNQWAHDAAGNITQHTDAAGAVWNFTYNSSGQLTTVDPPGIGTNLALSYDASGRPLARTDFAGGVTTYQHDALDRLTRVTHPDLTHQDYAYDALDRLTSWTNELGKAWTYQYDANGRPILRRDPLLLDHQFAYDALDRVVSWTDPLGGVTSFSYNLAGMLASWTDRTARTTTFSYDALDRLIQRTDPGGNSWQYAYDSDHRLIQVSSPNGTTQYQYDGLDRITRVTDALSNATDYIYDAVSREVRVIPPLGDQITYAYTPRLQLAQVRVGTPGSTTAQISWTYSSWGAPLTQTDPNGHTWGLAYSTSGLLASFTDPLARTTSYSYDSRNRLTQVSTPLGANSYAYDAAAQLTSRTLGAGPTIAYTYNDAGWLTGGSGFSRTLDGLGRVTGANGVSYSYDAEGRLTAVNYASGKTVTYTYDARGLLASAQDWVGGTTAFTHDAAGNPTQVTRPNSTTASYQYDAMGRLAHVTDGGATPILDLAFTRDARGLITSANRTIPYPAGTTPGTASYSYDAASQIVGYTYDANGRLLQGGGRAYEWDLGSRLTRLDQPEGTVTYAYDGLDRMVARDAGGARGFVWHEAAAVPAIHVERQGAADVRYLVRTPQGELLHSVEASNNARYFVHADERGGILAETTDGGSVSGMYKYDAKGRDTAHGSTGRYVYYPFRFGAGAVHEGQDLYRFGSRIYDAETASYSPGLPTVSDLVFESFIMPALPLNLLPFFPVLGTLPGGALTLALSSDLPPVLTDGTGGQAGGRTLIDTGLRTAVGTPTGPNNPAPPSFQFGSYGIPRHGSGGTGGTGGAGSGAPRIFILLPTGVASSAGSTVFVRKSFIAGGSDAEGDYGLGESSFVLFGNEDAPLGQGSDGRLLEGTVALFGNEDAPLGQGSDRRLFEGSFALFGSEDTPLGQGSDPRLFEGTFVLFGGDETPLGHSRSVRAPFVRPIPVRTSNGPRTSKMTRFGVQNNEKWP